jgi:RNA polymerase sigma-70 factor (ECF subfamily)
MPTSDELIELVNAVALRSDRGAFSALFKHFAPRIKAYLMRSGMAPELAEELAQDTMVNVWRKAASFDSERAQVSTWIFTIARNLRVDHFRRAHLPAAADDRSAALGADDLDPLTLAVHDAPGPEEEMIAGRREAAVRNALRQLAPEQRRSCGCRSTMNNRRRASPTSSTYRSAP